MRQTIHLDQHTQFITFAAVTAIAAWFQILNIIINSIAVNTLKGIIAPKTHLLVMQPPL